MTKRKKPADGTGTRSRWRIAALLNRLPGQCWTELVTWALGWRGLNPWSPIDRTCRTDLARNGECYCGKLREDG